MKTGASRNSEVLANLIKNPSRAFNMIDGEGKNFLIGALLIVLLPGIISALLNVDYTHLKGVVRDIAEWLISTVLLYFAGRILKGNADFVDLLSAIGYSRFPLIFPPVAGYFLLASIPEDVKTILENTGERISQEQATYVMTRLFSPLTVTLLLIALALIVWSFALSVIAVRELSKFSTWRAFCSVVLVTFIDTLVLTKLWEAL